MRKIIPLVLTTLLAAAALNAGSQDQKTTRDTPAGKAASQTPQVEGGAPVDLKTYVIGPADVLMVRVWREPDLSGKIAVRPDGKISLQLLKSVQAAGLTPEHLSRNIAKGLDQFMNHPEVTVNVVEVNSKKYYIIGEVMKPGAYPMPTPIRVLEALGNSGGFRDFAKSNKIIIIRGTQRFKFNYKDVIKGKHLEQNIYLQSGDQIVVP